MKDLKSARQRFKSMHSESFVIPNAWSVGEIRQLEKLGFGAIATTSAGLSASMGRKDLSLSRDETLQNIRTVCAATDLPVNADFEAGFADAAAGVGANVAMAAEAGVSGLSIEDRKGGALYALPEAVARIKAAAAIEQGPPGPHLEIRAPAWKQSWWTRSSTTWRCIASRCRWATTSPFPITRNRTVGSCCCIRRSRSDSPDKMQDQLK